MAIWGTWAGRGQKTHSLRFVLLHEGVRKPWAWATLRTQMETFGPGKQAGLLATTTNSPGMVLCVRVYEEGESAGSSPVTEFVVTNQRLIKERSRRPLGWSVRLIAPRFWRLKSDLVIANEYTSNEILVEKLYNLGPIVISRKFD
jgi:hypothetical protein